MEKPHKPHIAVVYNENFSDAPFTEFKKSINENGLNVYLESKPEEGAFLCIEWLMPTAVIVYIAKSYFDGFLNEMGKDHYNSLKKNLGSLTNEVLSYPRIEPLLVASNEGKISKNNPYSLAFSIIAEANNGKTFKLLLPKPSEGYDYSDIVSKFLYFLNDFHSGVSHIGSDDSLENQASGGTILVHLNPETSNIEVLDWREHVLNNE